MPQPLAPAAELTLADLAGSPKFPSFGGAGGRDSDAHYASPKVLAYKPAQNILAASAAQSVHIAEIGTPVVDASGARAAPPGRARAPARPPSPAPARVFLCAARHMQPDAGRTRLPRARARVLLSRRRRLAELEHNVLCRGPGAPDRAQGRLCGQVLGRCVSSRVQAIL
jgi:hypothetical protein